jgi:hypothetical protein
VPSSQPDEGVHRPAAQAYGRRKPPVHPSVRGAAGASPCTDRAGRAPRVCRRRRSAELSAQLFDRRWGCHQ